MTRGLLALAALLASASFAQEGALDSAALLELQCRSARNPLCLTYLLGVVDGANLERRYFCPPSRMAGAELPGLFVRYVAAHPEALRENRLTAARAALRAALPCRGE